MYSSFVNWHRINVFFERMKIRWQLLLSFTVATVVGIESVQHYKHNQFIWPIPRVIHILCKNWHCLLCCWSDLEGRGTCRYHHIDIEVLSCGFNFNKKLWAYYNLWWAPLTFMWFDQTNQQTKDFITVEMHDLCLWRSTILWLTQIGVCGLIIGNNFRDTQSITRLILHFTIYLLCGCQWSPLVFCLLYIVILNWLFTTVQINNL